jgi:ParB-like chromosome segregation protein Spo0J
MSVDEMLAQFRQTRNGNLPVATTAQPKPISNQTAITASTVHTDTGTVRVEFIPLDHLTINLRQPRRVLPDDLRRTFARGEQSAEETISTLIARAGTGDLEAQGHLANIRPLADSITCIGVEQPIQVIASWRDQDRPYEIKDGERRFWACVLLAGGGDKGIEIKNIPALIESDSDEDNTDDLLLTQWEINTQREGIPEIDVACYVRDTYRAMFDRVQADREGVRTQFKQADAKEWSDSALATALTVNAVHASTGRKVGPRMILLLTQMADKLAERTLLLARAHRLCQRDLVLLARAAPDSQVELAERLALRALSSGQTEASTQPAQTATKKRGRPKLAERELRICQRLVEQVTHRNPKQLARLSDGDVQKLLNAVYEAREALDQYSHLLRSIVSQSIHVHTGG